MEKRKGRELEWSEIAWKQLIEALETISLDSLQGAFIVEDAIYNALEAIPENPRIYPLDSLKINNDGSYRAFVVFHYRISYKIQSDVIVVLRVRHTSREPLGY
ncbi:type II toxin-antitoxin system RelE/ParE family toxin [bacterium]|nr:MAG: type II toxin-antitoxin system RelE/ParE family toxin [bacterium]